LRPAADCHEQIGDGIHPISGDIGCIEHGDGRHIGLALAGHHDVGRRFHIGRGRFLVGPLGLGGGRRQYQAAADRRAMGCSEPEQTAHP
jgi:hypothetical protein